MNIKLKFSDIEESYVIGLIWWRPRSMASIGFGPSGTFASARWDFE